MKLSTATLDKLLSSSHTLVDIFLIFKNTFIFGCYVLYFSFIQIVKFNLNDLLVHMYLCVFVYVCCMCVYVCAVSLCICVYVASGVKSSFF